MENSDFFTCIKFTQKNLTITSYITSIIFKKSTFGVEKK